jgi:hypothetical protein
MTQAAVIRPIRAGAGSVNQRLPSGPAAMPFPLLPGNSVMAPAAVMRAIPTLSPVNQRLPSAPPAMPLAPLAGNSVMTPAVVIRPILLPESSVNHRFPSAPAAMP